MASELTAAFFQEVLYRLWIVRIIPLDQRPHIEILTDRGPHVEFLGTVNELQADRGPPKDLPTDPELPYEPSLSS